jgi:hypothetical protein
VKDHEHVGSRRIGNRTGFIHLICPIGLIRLIRLIGLIPWAYWARGKVSPRAARYFIYVEPGRRANATLHPASQPIFFAMALNPARTAIRRTLFHVKSSTD